MRIVSLEIILAWQPFKYGLEKHETWTLYSSNPSLTVPFLTDPKLLSSKAEKLCKFFHLYIHYFSNSSFFPPFPFLSTTMKHFLVFIIRGFKPFAFPLHSEKQDISGSIIPIILISGNIIYGPLK